MEHLLTFLEKKLYPIFDKMLGLDVQWVYDVWMKVLWAISLEQLFPNLSYKTKLTKVCPDAFIGIFRH